ncbi:zinc finger BED domain-containing protein 1 [Austrofundulus limnaeus]|uniref:Zinc finger BED domain-containing protein 1 n=1 Tax=Austrofundulus limnaeus TaxID=52670 RepID=A0A2I4AW72_AUSLI|nr:PREDICTED: zinc finger BED domain-containing protein 1-like [Austrofundulus limnaeus]
MAATARTHASVPPFIITFGYKNFAQVANRRAANCSVCGIKIQDTGSTTSNFIRHLKTHPERFSEFSKAKKVASGEGQSSIDSFLTHPKGVQVYSQGHPRHKAITESIIQDLIISCNLPLSLIDKPSFKNFMAVVEEKYCPPSRSTVTRRLSELAAEKMSKIKSKLEKTDTVSATVDIWTDRSMRGFLGITSHFMELEKNGPKLQSVLLSCERFTGSHTGQRISEKFEEICDNFNIKHKLDYIISDNAANMKKAFTVCFPSTVTDSEDGDNDLENGNLWEEMSEEFQDDVESIQRSCQQQRLQCFAHSLQLVVRDGLKETKCINNAMAKLTRFCSLLHSTCSMKEAFEGQYGAGHSIPSAVSTRWNSTLRLVEAVTDLDLQNLNVLLETQGHKELCLSAREWSQLKELVEILSPFLQATDLTQGEKVVTVSAALPCVLSLNSHLTSMLNTTRHLVGFIKALQTSLHQRFKGIFVNVRMDVPAQPAEDLPFGDNLYLMSAFLDPSFCLFWLEQDVFATDEVKSEVKEILIDQVLAEARKVPLPDSSSGDDDQDEPPAKTPRLFSGYRKKGAKKTTDHSSSVRTELNRYIEVTSEEDGVDCLDF